MALDLVKNFRKHEQAIRRYMTDREASYFDSQCFKSLKQRYDKLNDSLDMRFNLSRNRNTARNQWQSKIAIPLVRESFLQRRATTEQTLGAIP